MKNQIQAEVKQGYYKGESLTLDIGKRPQDTEIRINGEVVSNVKNVEIKMAADEQTHKINLEFLAQPTNEVKAETNIQL